MNDSDKGMEPKNAAQQGAEAAGGESGAEPVPAVIETGAESEPAEGKQEKE